MQKSIDEINCLEIKNLAFSDIKDIPGIIKTEQKIQTNQNAIKKVFKEAFKNFLSSRDLEGEKIKKLFLIKINKINEEFEFDTTNQINYAAVIVNDICLCINMLYSYFDEQFPEINDGRDT